MYNLTKFYNTDSFIHKINPLYKIICVFIFTFLNLFSSTLIFTTILLLFLLIIMFVSNVPIKLYLNNFKYMILIIIFLFIINLLFGNIYQSILSVMKIILFVLYSQVLLYTTKINDLTYGLELFLKPLKIFNIDTSTLVFIISLSIRFIPTVFNQTDKILKSQISRGLDFKGSLSEKCDKIISVIVPVFTLSIKRSLDISYILDMRYYRVNSKRTKYNDFSITYVDTFILFINILFFMLFLCIEVI